MSLVRHALRWLVVQAFCLPLMVGQASCVPPSFPAKAGNPDVGSESRPTRETQPAAAPNTTYEIVLDRPQTQVFTIRIHVERVQEAEHVDFSMPAWRPGRYVILNRAGLVRRASATDGGGNALESHKIDKDTWRVLTDGADEVVFEYEIYADDLGTRTVHVDDSHAYIDASAALMLVEGRRHEPAIVRISAPQDWEVATGLEHAQGEGPRTFVAPDYDVLIDSPFEIGVHDRLTFEAMGALHEIIIWGDPEYDAEELTSDIADIVRVQGEMFGGLPYERYVFILHATEEAGGATEHLNSTVVQASPEAFEDGDRYEGLLATISHELFHTWNVKHARPAGLSPYDYSGENYTKLIWVAEGTTSYYDTLLLVRAGLADADEYLDSLAGAIGRYRRRPGRHVQSLAEASFNAWINFDQPNADSVNTSVSFYSKGSLVSLLLDMRIREASGGKASLDDVMRNLVEQYAWGSEGYTPQDFQRLAEQHAGASLDEFFAKYARGTAPLPFEEMFTTVGLVLKRDGQEEEQDDGASDEKEVQEDEDSEASNAYLGLDLRGGDTPNVHTVREDGPAFEAGVQVGDTIIAMNGRAVSSGDFDGMLEDVSPGDEVELTILRKDRLRTITMQAGERDERDWVLEHVDSPTPEQRQAYASWLGEEWPEDDDAQSIAEINTVLDDWHDAAADADFDRYVGHLAEDAVFLGTDATERWTREEFINFAKPHFASGDGWTYLPRDRHVIVDGDTAWFDELLDSAAFGECRGSGVLVREDGEWLIAQYNLSIPLPNALAKDIVEQIRGDKEVVPPDR